MVDEGGAVVRPVLNLSVVLLICGGLIGGVIVGLDLRAHHHGAATSVAAGIGVAAGTWVSVAMLILLIEIRDSVRALASDADRDR